MTLQETLFSCGNLHHSALHIRCCPRIFGGESPKGKLATVPIVSRGISEPTQLVCETRQLHVLYGMGIINLAGSSWIAGRVTSPYCHRSGRCGSYSCKYTAKRSGPVPCTQPSLR